MPIAFRQPSRALPLALVVSDSGLQRHRLRRILRRAGFDAPSAVGAQEAAAAISRGEWDVVVWAAPDAGEPLRRPVGRGAGDGTVLLLLDEGARAAAAAEALAAGFGDVVSAGAPAGELVERARAIARRSAAHRVLAAEASAFRELAEGGRDLLVRRSPDGTIRYVSGAARELLGQDPEALVGRRAGEVLHPDILDAGPEPSVHRVRRRDGGWVWMETTAHAVGDPHGRIREIHTDSRDVSERVRAEAERAALARVTAAVAEGIGFDRIAELVAREAMSLLGAETGGVVRFHGDEGIVLGAAGPDLRPGDRIPLAAAREGGAVAAVEMGGAPWGLVLARGGVPAGPEPEERLRRLAPLIGLAVSNSRSLERLTALATTDPLTGLANHRAFHERLAQECARAERGAGPLTLVLIDLDHFKRVNDTFGHQAGDEVLREVGRRLRAVARRGDVPARVGGEELAWLLPETSLAEGVEAAERLRAAIRGAGFPAVGRVTASLGVATFRTTAVDLGRRADQALYRAKEGGRDACVAWSADEAATAAPSG